MAPIAAVSGSRIALDPSWTDTARDEPDRRRVDAIEQRRGHQPIPNPPDPRPDVGDDHERRQEDGHRGDHGAGHAGEHVADEGGGREQRPRRDLANRDRVDELRIGEPAQAFDEVAAHQRDVCGWSAESDDPERAEEADQLPQPPALAHAGEG